MADAHVTTAVLLVDDQRFVGLAVGRLLAGEPDIAIHCCEFALEAMAYANRVQPALILQDLVMPQVDGFALVEQFRANPVTASTPIVVLSGDDDPSARARALAAGADDYLVKLPAKGDLIACIRRHVSGARGNAAAGSPSNATSSASIHDAIDRSVIAALREGTSANGSALMVGLIDQFLQETTSLIDTLKEAVRREDSAGVKAAAHSLKGASLTMGARRLALLSGQLEGHVDRATGGTVEPMLMAAIDDELVRVRKACALEQRSV